MRLPPDLGPYARPGQVPAALPGQVEAGFVALSEPCEQKQMKVKIEVVIAIAAGVICVAEPARMPVSAFAIAEKTLDLSLRLTSS